MKEKNEIEKIGRENVLRGSDEIEGLDIKGYDFNKGIDYEKLLESYLTTGFQATHFAKAVEIIDKMIKEKATIFLGYTSNLVTSGLRDIFRYLAEHKIANKIYLDKINTNGKKKITEEQINPNHLFSCLIDFKYSLVILFNILTGRTKGG